MCALKFARAGDRGMRGKFDRLSVMLIFWTLFATNFDLLEPRR